MPPSTASARPPSTPLHDAPTRLGPTFAPRWQETWTRTVYPETESTAAALEGLFRGVAPHLARGVGRGRRRRPGAAAVRHVRPAPDLADVDLIGADRRSGSRWDTIGTLSDAEGSMDVDQRVTRVGRFLRSKGPAEMLYGALVSSVVLAATSAGAETGEIVALATALVSVTYWLAHVYADAVGGRFEDTDHSAHHRLRHALKNNTGVLLGSLPVLVVFVIGRLLGMTVANSAFLALWFTVAMLAARRGVRGPPGRGPWRCARRARRPGGRAFGLLVIALKLILSH